MFWIDMALNMPVFALSGIASHFATQIDPHCDSTRQMHRTEVRHKINHKLFVDNGSLLLSPH